MNKIHIAILSLIILAFVNCTDLNIEPQNSIGADQALQDPQLTEAFLAKVYAALSLTGQIGPFGDPDIKGFDEGGSQYLRAYWKLQELPTDEAVIAWGDGTLQSLNTQTWTDTENFSEALYNQAYFLIGMANEFLRSTNGNKHPELAFFRAEVRFLRALSYWHVLDLFGNVPLVTDEDEIGGSVKPKQSNRVELFNFIESELLGIESELAEPKAAPYGRADRAGAWTLLARLYLNANVYTGQDKFSACLTYCNKVINSGAYGLTSNYQANFLADNHTSSEVIFPIPFDGTHTRTFGGTTFLAHACVGGDMDAASFGLNGGWAGLRTTSVLVDLFPDETGDADERAIFFTEGQTKEIATLTSFRDGYAVPKYQNVSSVGAAGVSAQFVDTDFPLFRLAEVYLTYAEAVLRGGTGGDRATALGFINQLKQRAYGNTSGDITEAEMTLDFILDERARELYWEAIRRTDLIRFDQFTNNGIWPWKGGVAEGQTTPTFRNLYAIPVSDITANPDLVQNEGY